jgi:sugar (pentulose or hexulose) kinase
VGIGLHDSSAALIPYRVRFREPFLLLSTGTWCITLNPFNNTPLTPAELQQDCLCYLDYKGHPVKAARLFLGPQYEAGVKRISAHFNQSNGRYSGVSFDAAITATVKQKAATWGFEKVPFEACDLHRFENDIEAYHYLMLHLVQQQCRSIQLVLQPDIKQLFVDGGFSKNEVFMNLLATHFPEQEVYAASMAQGTALGAALALHDTWNKTNLPTTIVAVKRYACTAGVHF